MKSRRNRLFWLEGVTEREVVTNLNDTAPSRLRSRRVRRGLVAFATAVSLGIGILALLPDTKLRSYFEFAGIAALIVVYLQLRKSVRLIADAPAELLDERQIAVRDAAHTVAYRILACVSTFFLALYLAADSFGTLANGRATPLLIGFLMLAGSLPSMVLAWSLPEEASETAESPPSTP